MNHVQACLLATGLVLLGGCAGRSPAGALAEAYDVHGFSVELREVTLSATRTFNTPSHSFLSPQGAATVTISLALLDRASPGRMLRVCPDSALTSVRSGDNVELLQNEAWFGTRTHGNAAHVTKGAAFTVESSPRTFSVPVNVGYLPASLNRVAGHLNLEVVSAESTKIVPLPAIGESVDAGDLVLLSLSSLELDDSTGAPRLAAVELTTPSPPDAGAVASPVINAVELIDEGGTTLASLQRREEYALAGAIKRRFVFEGQRQHSGSRSAPARAPTGIRIRMYPSVTPIQVPFQWGPIGITGTAASGR